jgi:serine/threonine protein kinase
MDERYVGGRYRLLEAHAMGGMASIWRAVDESTGSVVAVKRLHPFLITDPVARERLLREAAALRGLRHPNVVAVRDLVADPDDPALILEFVPGRTAAEALATDGPFDEPAALAIAASVADALGAAHRRGLVHRDVKPSNVLLGDDGRVRLADFGIAVDEVQDTALTDAGSVVGTLRYLAPERVGGAPATPASDLWSLGAVLFELLTGEPFIAVADPLGRLAEPQPHRRRPHGMSRPAWTIVTRATAAAPARRYPDADALASALHRRAGTLPDPSLASDVDPWAETQAIAVPPSIAAPSDPSRRRAPAHRTATVPRLGIALATAGIALVTGLAVIAADGPSAGIGDHVVPSATATRSPAPSATAKPSPKATATPAPAVATGKDGPKGKGKRRGKHH